MAFCDDCPDREACHQGTPCDLARRFAFVANLYQQKMKGNTTMSNAKNTNVTPADVVAKATEEKLITTVPAQAEEVDVDARTCESQVDESPELTVIEGGKKSLKERLAVVTEKLKENKKVLITVGAAAGVAALAFAKYAKKKAEEALAVEPLDEAEGPVIGVDDSAA